MVIFFLEGSGRNSNTDNALKEKHEQQSQYQELVSWNFSFFDCQICLFFVITQNS